MKSGKLWRGQSPVLGDTGLHSSGMGRHWLCRKEDHTDVEFPHVPGESRAGKLPMIGLRVHALGNSFEQREVAPAGPLLLQLKYTQLSRAREAVLRSRVESARAGPGHPGLGP